jgi:hypothetical protein
MEMENDPDYQPSDEGGERTMERRRWHCVDLGQGQGGQPLKGTGEVVSV